MPRATTKEDLLKSAQTQYEKLWDIIHRLSDEEKQATFHFDGISNLKEAHWNRDQNLRDVLIHLYEWHQLLLNWVQSNLAGVSKPFLPEPYNWKNYGQMNVAFWEKHQNTTLDDATTFLNESHQQVLELIDRFTNEELFAKNALPWTGTSPLGSYCTSATASHYDWAIKKVKLHTKVLHTQ